MEVASRARTRLVLEYHSYFMRRATMQLRTIEEQSLNLKSVLDPISKL